MTRTTFGQYLWQTQEIVEGWYFNTYSKADLAKFQICDSLGNMIEKHFSAGTEIKTKVECWACSREDHQDGNKHYHVSLKL